jgi:2'-5' RNA ligase
MRVFMAVDLPDALKDGITMLSKELGACGVRMVSKDAMHITLCFIGEVEENRIEGIKKVMDGIKAKPFELTMKGVGTFDPRMPRVVFIEIDKGGDELKGIYDQLRSGLEAIGLGMESREYTPHLTLARVRDPHRSRECLDRFLKTHKEDFGGFVCDSIKLKKSTFTGGDVVHSVLFEKRFASA